MNDSDIQSDAWLDERVRLFEAYCIPSIVNQSVKKFTWLVLFDSKSPSLLRMKIAEWCKHLKEKMVDFIPLFLEPYGNENQLVVNYINSNLRGETKYITTTRLDSDDSIRFDFMEKIIDYVSTHPLNDAFMNFSNGLQYNLKRKCFYLWMNYYSNHYLTRVEKMGDEIKTVLCDHTDVSKFALYVELPYVESMWVELIHSRNTANRMATDKLIHVDGSLYVGKDVDSYRTPYIIYCIWLIIGKARYILKYIRRKIEKHIFRRK